MNTKREAVLNLISLLVKKSGYDLNDSYTDEELFRIKENIEKLKKEKDHSIDKKYTQKLIDNLKLRQSLLENNALSLGRNIIKAFDEGQNIDYIKTKINELCDLSVNSADSLQVNFIYDRISELEKELDNLEREIDKNDYINYEEKEMDNKLKNYLENRLETIDVETNDGDKELESLKEIEAKDLAIVEKIRKYNKGLSDNFETLSNAANENTNTVISFEIWEKLEKTKDDIEEKLEKSKELLAKTESALDDVQKRIHNINLTKKTLLEEKNRCENKLKIVNNKLETGDYINNAKKMLDISRSEMIKTEINTLKNKKDYIYVDASKVKEELFKQWDTSAKENKLLKEKETSKKEDIPILIANDEVIKQNDVIEEPEVIEEVQNHEVEEKTSEISEINNEQTIEIKTPEIKEEKKNKYELDW